MAELRSSWSAPERLLWRSFLDLEGKIQGFRIWQQSSAINSIKQTLRMRLPAAATDPKRTLDATNPLCQDSCRCAQKAKAKDSL
jgi:hypothetical protein